MEFSEVLVVDKRARNFLFPAQLLILCDRGEKKADCHYFLTHEYLVEFHPVYLFVCAMCKAAGYLQHSMSDNCAESSVEVFHQQVYSIYKHSFSLQFHRFCPVQPFLFIIVHVCLHISRSHEQQYSPQKPLLSFYIPAHKSFYTLTSRADTLLAKSKPVKVMDLKGGRRYENVSEVACDCLFSNMYSSYQEHPMGSDTCLQRPLGSLHGPHQSKNTATLQRLLAGAAIEANKQTKENLSLKQVPSPLIINTVQMYVFICCTCRKFSLNFLVLSMVSFSIYLNCYSGHKSWACKSTKYKQLRQTQIWQCSICEEMKRGKKIRKTKTFNILTAAQEYMLQTDKTHTDAS